ncbi:MAG: WXG100 family type VII secretion target [Atopobiaceae bacterium]|nr:WXG100 family type VII secretion target [Atopobiaceae bacterium]
MFKVPSPIEGARDVIRSGSRALGGAQVKVNTDSINDMRRRANTELDRFTQAMGEMRSSVDALNATWKGGNHDKFLQTFEERYKQMEELQKMLKNYLSSIDKAVSNYEQCESEVSSLAAF